MRLTDRNIIMITAGGVGNRFGNDIPKQYLLLNGRPVISYVIDACKKSRFADSILVVSDPLYHDDLRSKYGVDVTSNGPELNNSKWNGFQYIKEHSDCKKLIVVDAVRPAIEASVLDDIFSLLDEYDAVACARKITDSLGRYNEHVVNRDEYYTMNAPEGFRFSMIYNSFDPQSKITESIQQLPDTAKVYLNFDVPYYDKITYPEDLVKAEAFMQWRSRHGK